MASPDLELQWVHATRRRTAGALAVRVEDAAVAGANELRLIRVPVDGAAQVRADGGEDGDPLFAFVLAANPDGVLDASLFPAVLVHHLDGEQPLLPHLDVSQAPSVLESCASTFIA